MTQNFFGRLYRDHPVYSGAEKDVKVYLYKNGNHFDTIGSMTAFYGQSYYCEKCDKPYQNKDKHKCKTKDKICIMCFKSNHKEEYIVKNAIDTVLIKNVYKIILKFVKDFINA
jgi:hypothetical protein